MGTWKRLQWIRANGGEWTSDAVRYAAQNGHSEVVRWIRENGYDYNDHDHDISFERLMANF